MYSVAMALCAVIVSWITREWQFPSPHWAVLSCLVTMQSLKSVSEVSNILQSSIERVVGALLGIALGYFGLIYMQIFVTDLLRVVYFVILFIVVLIAGKFSELHDGFKLAPIAAALMISLMAVSHEPLLVMNAYALCLICGVVTGAIMSVLLKIWESRGVN